MGSLKVRNNMINNVNSVYIHIPFCENICTYCDFCKQYYNENLVNKYLDKLKDEISINYNNDIINTIYIGGGTPSCLKTSEIIKLLEITKMFNTNNLEFTLECNIENIDEDKIKLLRDYGVNRVSVGIQTFNEKYLSFLGRNHKKDDVISKINMVKKYINNINIDLIYAIPDETITELENDINEFLKLDIPHISTYSLIIEDNTILKNNNVCNIDEDYDYKMYEVICNKLQINGFNHYETSNFSKIGYESRHNLVYWNNKNYYGFGLGASGYINNVRYTNTRSINKYLNNNFRLEEDILTINEEIENEFILGFRKVNGINIDSLYKKYNLDIYKLEFINNLLSSNRLLIDNNYIKINPKYLYVSNDILIEFMGVDYERYI